MKVNLKLLSGQSAAFFVIFALLMFVPAGNWVWAAGWVFLLVFLACYAAIEVWLLRHNPALLQERTHLGTSDQQGWDKLLFPLLVGSTLVWLGLMSLDAERWHWSRMPLWLQGAGLVLLLASFYMLFLTFRENSFLSPVVRVQSDRGHQVVSTGPYHVVRHPMYAAILVFTLGTALLLGSWLGVLLGPAVMLILARRAVLEERTLRENLTGYTDYMGQVRYRIIPGVW
jgi:protein-S-isoprenylcysteine O-methyltransferase Ste14